MLPRRAKFKPLRRQTVMNGSGHEHVRAGQSRQRSRVQCQVLPPDDKGGRRKNCRALRTYIVIPYGTQRRGSRGSARRSTLLTPGWPVAQLQHREQNHRSAAVHRTEAVVQRRPDRNKFTVRAKQQPTDHNAHVDPALDDRVQMLVHGVLRVRTYASHDKGKRRGEGQGSDVRVQTCQQY